MVSCLDSPGICYVHLLIGTSPGRMYAAAIMKQIIAQVILNYDIRLVREDEKRCWVWRSSILPLEKTEIAFLARTT